MNTKLIEDLRDQAKGLKEKWVADHPTDPDGPSYVYVIRNDEPVAMITCVNDRDIILRVLQVCAFGFSADALLFTMEALTTTTMTNPITGENWDNGEMAVVAKEYPEYLRDGTLRETFNIAAYTRDDDTLYFIEEFQVEDGKVVWIKDLMEHEDHRDQMGGFVHEKVKEFLSSPTMLDKIQSDLDDPVRGQMIQSLMPRGREEFELAQEMSTLKFLAENDLASWGALMAVRPERAEAIEKRMAILSNAITENGGDPDEVFNIMRAGETDE